MISLHFIMFILIILISFLSGNCLERYLVFKNGITLFAFSFGTIILIIMIIVSVLIQNKMLLLYQ